LSLGALAPQHAVVPCLVNTARIPEHMMRETAGRRALLSGLV
jgi:hypothetical protein